MACEQKTNHFNAAMKTDFDESNWKNKYHSAGYWKSVIEFIQQCILCSNRKKETDNQKVMNQLFQ